MSALTFSTTRVVVNPVGSGNRLLDLASTVYGVVKTSDSSTTLATPVAVSVLPARGTPVTAPFSSTHTDGSFVTADSGGGACLSGCCVRRAGGVYVVVAHSKYVSVFRTMGGSLRGLCGVAEGTSLTWGGRHLVVTCMYELLLYSSFFLLFIKRGCFTNFGGQRFNGTQTCSKMSGHQTRCCHTGLQDVIKCRT